ncbi:zinc finger protein DZIP1L, partial [Clonorchis sinensis]
MTELKIKETIPVCQLTQFLHGPPSSGLNFIQKNQKVKLKSDSDMYMLSFQVPLSLSHYSVQLILRHRTKVYEDRTRGCFPATTIGFRVADFERCKEFPVTIRHVVLEIICGNHDLNIAVECLRKYTMIMRKECSLRNTPVHPFVFRQRKEKVDWRRLASIDVNRVINEMDVGTLQDVLSSVAFCDITCEVDMRCVDSNLIKLFQLAQLLVEYLLHSQNYLISSVNSLKEENASLQKDLSSAKQDLAEKMNKLTAVRRECHRRRLLLLAQQQLMDSGPQSYHRCLYCPKAFLNASFLAAHVQRRHLETENPRQPQTLIAECGSKKTPLMAETVHIQTNNVQ